MSVYADSSFIAGLYVPVDESPFDIWRTVGEVALPFTPMHRLEVRNAIRRRVRETRPERRISHNEAVGALQTLDSDLADRRLQHVGINWTNVLRRAEEIGRQYTEQTGIRALDLFHLAAAVESGHGTLLTFDVNQADAARLIGLAVHGA